MEKTAKQRALEWEETYGGLSEHELSEVPRKSIRAKFEAAREKAEKAEKAEQNKYNKLSYGDLIKAVASTKKKLSALEGDPPEKDTITDRLRAKKRAELEARYAEAKKWGMEPDSNKDLWISEQLGKYMHSDEYMEAKNSLADTRKELAILLAKKEEREAALADVIEAERYRTRRADLLSADPEALRALGIEPPTTDTPSSESSDSGSDHNYMDGTVNDEALLASFMRSRGVRH